jgi:hypothetical protein
MLFDPALPADEGIVTSWEPLAQKVIDLNDRQTYKTERKLVLAVRIQSCTYVF